MAKAPSGKGGGGTSRIRFVMVDAEIAEGEIGPITQAIQNALRGPGYSTVQRLPPSPPRITPQAQDGNGADQSEEEIDLDSYDENGDAPPAQPRQPRVRRAVPKTPNVVPLDMNADLSLASFALGKDAKSQHKKFLISAAWLKEHRGIDAVTDDHMYTCIKSMGWPTNIPDFSQPLRDLKKKRYFAKSDKGYEINHIGLDYVKKLGGANGVG